MTDARLNMAGMKIGKWSVLGFSHRSRSGFYWLCRCECGTVSAVRGAPLRHGQSLMCSKCGLLHRKTHGEAGRKKRSSEYRCWEAMIYRCKTDGPGGRGYADRGIRVAERWKVFENFLADMGRKPSPKHSIDRIDVNGHYESGNCRWADPKTQARNTRVNRIVEFGGVRGPVAHVVEQLGLPLERIKDRLGKGWTVDRAFSTPIIGRPHHAVQRCITAGKIRVM